MERGRNRKEGACGRNSFTQRMFAEQMASGKGRRENTRGKELYNLGIPRPGALFCEIAQVTGCT